MGNCIGISGGWGVFRIFGFSGRLLVAVVVFQSCKWLHKPLIQIKQKSFENRLTKIKEVLSGIRKAFFLDNLIGSVKVCEQKI